MVDHHEMILQMDEDAMVKELRKEMEALGEDNFKKYFSSEYFTQIFEQQVKTYGIHDGSDTESREIFTSAKNQKKQPDFQPAYTQSMNHEKAEERPSTRTSEISSFKVVDASGVRSRKVTEILLKSPMDKVEQDKSTAPLKNSEVDDFVMSDQRDESREKLPAIPEEIQETKPTQLVEEGKKDEERRDVEEEIVEGEEQLDYETNAKNMSSTALVERHLSDLEKSWLMFLKVSLSGIEKRLVKVKPVKSDIRNQLKKEKETVETDFPLEDVGVPVLEVEAEFSNIEANDLKIEEQFKSYKEGEIRESLADFGLEEEFVDVLKKITPHSPSVEISLNNEKDIQENQSDSSLINSDEMDEINASFTKNVIITPGSSKIKKLIDIPYYLTPPDVRAPIKVSTSLQEAQEKMLKTMGQNYFSSRIVYAFEFDPKKLSHENLMLAFRDYVVSQNAGYKDMGLLAGCLFTYETYHQGIVMVEGGEYQITRHFADLKATEIYLALKKSRILFVHTYIQEQYLKKWIFVATSPPIGTDTQILPPILDEKAKEYLILLTDKLHILFHYLEQRETMVTTNCAEIDLSVDIHLKLPSPQLIEFILDYYALRPLHVFIDEIYNIPDTHDSSEDEQIFPEDVPYYAIQPEKHELLDILDYMVEDKSLNRKKRFEREVKKKMEAEGKPYKEQLVEDEHDIQLMYDIDDTESTRQLDVDTVYVENFDESIKAKLISVPYGKDLEGYDRIRRFKGRPDLGKVKQKKQKKKKAKEVTEERSEEQLKDIEIEKEEIIEEIFGEGHEIVYEQPGWAVVSETKIPTEPLEPLLAEVYGEREGESGRRRKKSPYRKLFRYSSKYKVPYKELGPAISVSTARTSALEEEQEIEREEDENDEASGYETE